MPYTCRLMGGKYVLTKKNSTKAIGTHDSEKSCKQQMRAIYANESSNPKNLVFNDFISMPFDMEDKIVNSGDEINVYINSRGGDFIDAIKIHNQLRSSGKRVICYIDPFAYSAGAVLALAGDEVYMVENGLLYFHTPKIITQGMKDATQLEKMSEALRANEEVLVNTLMSKTKKSHDECIAIMNDTWMTPTEAMNMGIVDEIIPINRDVKMENISNLGINFPERILNFVREKSDMGLKEICKKFSLPEDDTGETKLVEMIENLQKNQLKPKLTVTPSIINMVRSARETELNSLVADGKIIPAVATDLKKKYITDEQIVNFVETESPEFDNIVNSLKMNESVISFKGRTGVQKLPGSIESGSDEENTLVNDMKNRSKK